MVFNSRRIGLTPFVVELLGGDERFKCIRMTHLWGYLHSSSSHQIGTQHVIKKAQPRIANPKVHRRKNPSS